MTLTVVLRPPRRRGTRGRDRRWVVAATLWCVTAGAIALDSGGCRRTPAHHAAPAGGRAVGAGWRAAGAGREEGGGDPRREPARLRGQAASVGGVSGAVGQSAGDHRPAAVVVAAPAPEPVQVVRPASAIASASLAAPGALLPEMVTVKIVVDPPQRAHVFWGVKDLGPAPLEIRRPRGSGPVDLILRAPGYLTVHTRAFTERDDKLAFKLVPETDAARMFGYHLRQLPRQGR